MGGAGKGWSSLGSAGDPWWAASSGVLHVAFATALHELQRERTLSAAFVASRGALLGREVAEAHTATDAAVRRVLDVLGPAAAPVERVHREACKHRAAVAALESDCREATAVYNGLAAQLLTSASSLAQGAAATPDAHAPGTLARTSSGTSVETTAFFSFLSLKEAVAHEHACIAGTLVTGAHVGDTYRDLIVNYAMQQAYMRAFRSTAPRDILKMYDSGLNALPEVYCSARDRLLASSDAHTVSEVNVSGAQWVDLALSCLNMMRQIDRTLGHHVQSVTSTGENRRTEITPVVAPVAAASAAWHTQPMMIWPSGGMKTSTSFENFLLGSHQSPVHSQLMGSLGSMMSSREQQKKLVLPKRVRAAKELMLTEMSKEVAYAIQESDDEPTMEWAANQSFSELTVAVREHFESLPTRYILSVTPGIAVCHMQLIREYTDTDQLCVGVDPAPDLEGDDQSESSPSLHGSREEEDQRLFVVSTVTKNEPLLLEAVSHTLNQLPGMLDVVDADVMTSKQQIAVNTFTICVSKHSALFQELGCVDDRAVAEEIRNFVLMEMARWGRVPSPAQVALDPEFQLSLNEIEFGPQIGVGQVGPTYAARWRGTEVAVKVTTLRAAGQPSMDEAREKELLKSFHTEVDVISKLRHPNVCLFLGVAVAPPTYCLVLEYLGGGTLFERLREAPEIDTLRIATGVARGMAYIHSKHLIHRDLKSPNLLCDRHGGVKVTDFGLSVFDMPRMGTKTEHTAETGTYRWMAPEVVQHEPYSNKADVYSYGIILWECLTKKLPYEGYTPVQAALGVVMNGLRPELPECAPQSIQELIRECWDLSPSSRPSFDAIVARLEGFEDSMSAKEKSALGYQPSPTKARSSSDSNDTSWFGRLQTNV